MGKLIKLDETNFDNEVLKSDVPVLVDFWAPWCMPCRMIAPTIEKIADEYDGKVKVGKLNTDENQQKAFEYQIQGIPSLLLYKNGEVVDRIIGVVQKEHITQKLDYFTSVN